MTALLSPVHFSLLNIYSCRCPILKSFVLSYWPDSNGETKGEPSVWRTPTACDPPFAFSEAFSRDLSPRNDRQIVVWMCVGFNPLHSHPHESDTNVRSVLRPHFCVIVLFFFFLSALSLQNIDCCTWIWNPGLPDANTNVYQDAFSFTVALNLLDGCGFRTISPRLLVSLSTSTSCKDVKKKKGYSEGK